MQKKALRNISLSKYNAHTDPLFNKYNFLKFEDLVKYNSGIFMFNVAIGSHPHTINKIFLRSENFDRNLDFVKQKLRYSYLQKQVPYSLVNTWNSIPTSIRGWLKENREGTINKKISAAPLRVFLRDNCLLNQFRLNGFKKALTQTTLTQYKMVVSCKNTFCSQCNT